MESYDYDMFAGEYQEFADIPMDAVERTLAQAHLMLALDVWGNWHHMALGLWTAHYLALVYDISDAAAALGMRSPYEIGVTNSMAASTGGLAETTITPAILSGDDPVQADFARTAYGLRFLNLLTVIPAGITVFSPDTSVSGQAG